MQYKRGFTLIEMIIVITILGVLAAIMAPVLQSGFNAYFTERNLAEADGQASIALARLTRDVRDLPSTNGISTATSNQLTFTDRNNQSVTYVLSGTNLLRNTQVLAAGVNTLTFAYYDNTGAVTAAVSNMAYITATLNITENSTDLTMFSTINLRNTV